MARETGEGAQQHPGRATTGRRDRVEQVDRAVGRLAGAVGGPVGSTAGLLVWSYVAGRQLDTWLAEALDGTGLATSDYVALAGVAYAAEDDLLSAGDLADWVVQTSGGTAKTIQRLVERGLVRRVADPDDGRRTLLEATGPGRRTADRVATGLFSRLDADLAGLDVAERKALRDALRRLAGVLARG